MSCRKARPKMKIISQKPSSSDRFIRALLNRRYNALRPQVLDAQLRYARAEARLAKGSPFDKDFISFVRLAPHVVDRFHFPGRVGQFCAGNCSPDLPHHAKMLHGGCNQSICEATFVWRLQVLHESMRAGKCHL